MKLPPLGVMPRYIWEEKRIIDLREAIIEYANEGFQIPQDWIEEYNTLIKERKVKT